MAVQNNPFLYHTFTKKWCTHFVKDEKLYTNEFIDIEFYKPYLFPLYVNIGSTLTKGISYKLFTDKFFNNLTSKSLLVYDVPKHFDLQNSIPDGLGLLKVKQYPGYLIQLSKYEGLNDYMSKAFSKSSRQKFNRYKQRLEQCFNIEYKMYYGEISTGEYDSVFKSFYKLLTKRFDDKETINNNLFDHEWKFYQDVVYQMILEKKASLYVIYSNSNPISVRLNYYSDTIMFDAITVFDIDYSKFHLGKISIMKILEWAFENKYKKFDFSKGYFDYKESWGDLKYDFEYHLIYNKKSIFSTILAKTVYYGFRAKQFLREKRLNEKLHKLTYSFKNKSNNQMTFTELEEGAINIEEISFLEINPNEEEWSFLKRELYDFIYVAKEPIENMRLFRGNYNDRKIFLLKTDKLKKIIQANKTN